MCTYVSCMAQSGSAVGHVPKRSEHTEDSLLSAVETNERNEEPSCRCRAGAVPGSEWCWTWDCVDHVAVHSKESSAAVQRLARNKQEGSSLSSGGYSREMKRAPRGSKQRQAPSSVGCPGERRATHPEFLWENPAAALPRTTELSSKKCETIHVKITWDSSKYCWRGTHQWRGFSIGPWDGERGNNVTAAMNVFNS